MRPVLHKFQQEACELKREIRVLSSTLPVPPTSATGNLTVQHDKHDDQEKDQVAAVRRAFQEYKALVNQFLRQVRAFHRTFCQSPVYYNFDNNSGDSNCDTEKYEASVDRLESLSQQCQERKGSLGVLLKDWFSAGAGGASVNLCLCQEIFGKANDENENNNSHNANNNNVNGHLGSSSKKKRKLRLFDPDDGVDEFPASEQSSMTCASR